MNGRIEIKATPEGRLAAVAKSIENQQRGRRKECDYADYELALRPFVKRELLLAQIASARKHLAALEQEFIEMAVLPDFFELPHQ